MKFFKELDRWWFGRGSPVSLGLFRIFIAGNALLSLVVGLVDFNAWFTENGYVPLAISRQYLGGTYLRMNLMPDAVAVHPALTLGFYLLVVLAALFTTVGLWTRVSSIVLALGLISLHHRNAMILHSGDTLMRLMIIYIAAAPSGAACSLDRIIALWKGRAEGDPPLISLWGQRLIQLQVSIVYFTTLWWKWYGLRWKDGTATWFPVQLTEFYRFPMPEFVDRQPFVAMSTYGTLVAEFAMAVFVFYRPLRKWALLLGVLLHLGIEYRMNIPFFATVIMAGYVCYYDGEEVSAWARRLGVSLKRFQLKVFLPEGKAFRPGPGLAVQALDPLGMVTYEKGAQPEWVAVNSAGLPRRPFFGSWVRSIGAWVLTHWGLKRMMVAALGAAPEEAPAPTPKTKKVAAQRAR